MRYIDFPEDVFKPIPENCNTVVYRNPQLLGFSREIKHSEVRPVVSIDGLQILALHGKIPKYVSGGTWMYDWSIKSCAWWLNEKHTLLAVGSQWEATRPGAWVWYYEWQESVTLADGTTADAWCRRTMMWKELSELINTVKVMQKLQQVGGTLDGSA